MLPFGLRDACYAFTELVKVPVRALQAKGSRILPYLDDILCLLQQMSQADADDARATLAGLGFLLSFSKSTLVPPWSRRTASATWATSWTRRP